MVIEGFNENLSVIKQRLFISAITGENISFDYSVVAGISGFYLLLSYF